MVLIVVDDYSIREMLSHALSQFGYDTYKAQNSAEALEILRKRPQIKVVILDTGISTMDVRERCLLLKNLQPDIKIIISSTFIDETAIKELNNIGIKYILSKPYSITYLQEIINII